jgi:RTX calcium-binding nonapeptide repeat (4 copies)
MPGLIAKASVVALAVAVVALVVALPVAAEGEGEPVSCAYLEAGEPGPAGNVLRIEDGSRSVTHIYREGDAIVVYNNAHRDPIACSGEAPTVFNLDRIEYTATSSSQPFIDYIGHLPLAPGATAETAGSEIEISIHEDYSPKVLNVSGTAAGETIEAGLLGPHQIGLNLNAQADGPAADADVILDAPDPTKSVIRVTGANGDDTISALGGPGLSAPLDSERIALAGGPGNDRLIGGKQKDRLNGGPGDDVLLGGRGRDYLTIGPGRDLARAGAGPDQIFNESDVGGLPPDLSPDRVFAGAGNDRIDVSQPLPGDRVDCGPGAHDFVFTDPGDHTTGCEQVEVVHR